MAARLTPTTPRRPRHRRRYAWKPLTRSRVLLSSTIVSMAGPSRILVAGCSETDVEFVKDVTLSLDRVIEIVHLGAECLTKLQLFQPHLVLIDTTISNPDTFQLCRDVKSDHTAMVVIVTGVSELGNIQLGVEAGTDGFLPKPLKRSEVLRGIKDLLALRR